MRGAGSVCVWWRLNVTESPSGGYRGNPSDMDGFRTAAGFHISARLELDRKGFQIRSAKLLVQKKRKENSPGLNA